jgi:CheY-like chemotaxis protein
MTSQPGNILIVDDDPLMRGMLTRLLELDGFHVIAAEDGLEALHMLRTVRRRAPEAPCLVLLDLKMPRLGGDEFRRAQLSDPTVATVPVIVMSGVDDVQRRGDAIGAVAAIAKPIEREALLQVVRRYCA